MSTAQIVLVVMAALVSGFALITLYGEFMPAVREYLTRTRELTQTGDSSLSPHSVNWLAGAALGGATWIAVVLI